MHHDDNHPEEEIEAKEESSDAGETDLQQQLAQMTEHAKRTMADMQNLKRRQEEERKVLVSMANTNLIRTLLPVLDNLERAMGHIPPEAEKWAEGMQMSVNQFKKSLQDAGLEEIECQGQIFNPELHEALVHEAGEKDQVTEVLEKGYKLGDRVIRHAKVKVGNGES